MFSRHHHHSYRSDGKKRKWRWRGIRKAIKKLLSKLFPGDKNKKETDRQRLVKRAIFLIFLIILFISAFYTFVLNEMNGEELSKARSSSSEITQLKKQVSKGEAEIKKLKAEIEQLEAELEIYKENFGELDFGDAE